MEILGFIFGIFGFLAYMQIDSLKDRIKELEEQLTNIKGTSYHDNRTALQTAAKQYIGQSVNIELKDDYMDFDIINYGNTKKGSNVILDADDKWMLVQIHTPKGIKEKIIRLAGIQNISIIKKEQAE